MPALAVRAKPSPAQWSDRMLLRRVLEGEQRAWNEFIRRYRLLIYRCINKITGKRAPWLPAADIDEIYSDILCSLWKNDMHKLRLFDPRRGIKLSSWLGTVTVNATYDYLRCHCREWVIDAPDVDPDWIEEYERSPLDILLERERWQHFSRVLDRFSARDRRFLELYYGRGLDSEAIASAMSISTKTVYSKKHKIRVHLRRTLARTRRSGPLSDLRLQTA